MNCHQLKIYKNTAENDDLSFSAVSLLKRPLLLLLSFLRSYLKNAVLLLTQLYVASKKNS